VDESGFYLLPALVRSYAPCGHRPLLRVLATRDHLAAMSAVTLSGRLYTKVGRQVLTGVASVSFLHHLQRQLGRRLLVIWDGSPIHRGAEVKSFLAGPNGGSVHLERLPAYAPDLNPDEGVWQHLKTVEMRNLCCQDLDHLHHELTLAIARLRHKPDLIKSFFDRAGLEI
jgi:transposase